jgi:hypothetical protein
MHPFFTVVDHRVDQDYLPLEERRIIRRSQPERLRLTLPGPGAPFVNVTPVRPRVQRGPGLVARIIDLLRARGGSR